MNTRLITIKTFHDSVKAHLIKMKLEEQGIQCFLFDEKITAMIPMHDVGTGTIKLKVKETDQEKAIHILDQLDFNVEDLSVVICPHCNHPELEHEVYSDRGIMGMIKDFIKAFKPKAKHKYQCTNCGEGFMC